MLKITNVKKIDGSIGSLDIISDEDSSFDAKGELLLLPALIDPHVHFRVPGNEHKEDWKTGAKAAIAGGVTTVFDMPNNNPPPVCAASVLNKKKIIDSHLEEAQIPLRYHLWLGANKEHLALIPEAKDHVVGIKVYMGSTTGGLLMDDPQSIEAVFKIAAEHQMVVAVHAEDEQLMRKLELQYAGINDPAVHSKIRDRQAAILAVEQAISFSEKYGTKLYVAHVSTRDELELIRDAKKRGLHVYAEVTPHHLHLTEADYTTQGTFVQVNPPIRTYDDVEALWDGIVDGTVDTVGSDHAPHTIEEKKRPYGQAPSGVPGVEMILPLLMSAHQEGKISLKRIEQLTSSNARKLFGLDPCNDWVLIDQNHHKIISHSDVKSKCGWTPYRGMKCKGWPKYTILKGKLYEV